MSTTAPMTIRGAALAVALSALVALSGCVQRRLLIDSEPPGARVTINGYTIGETPTPPIGFDFYGEYEIMLEKDGYAPRIERVTLDAPWYGYLPMSIIADLLPWRIRNRYAFRFELEPLERPDTQALVEKAHSVQEDVRADPPSPAMP